MIEHVSEVIGEKNDEEILPKTRHAIRTAALNGHLRLYGCISKEVDKAAYSSVVTEIPKEYWKSAEINAMATLEFYYDTENPLTNREKYTDGTFGSPIYFYQNIEAYWPDVLKEWPKYG